MEDRERRIITNIATKNTMISREGIRLTNHGIWLCG